MLEVSQKIDITKPINEPLSSLNVKKDYLEESNPVKPFFDENYVILNKNDKQYTKCRIKSRDLYNLFIVNSKSKRMTNIPIIRFKTFVSKLNVEEHKFNDGYYFIGIKHIDDESEDNEKEKEVEEMKEEVKVVRPVIASVVSNEPIVIKPVISKTAIIESKSESESESELSESDFEIDVFCD